MTAAERFARAANLPLAAVPAALTYLCARLAEADGEVELVRVEIRPDAVRYFFAQHGPDEDAPLTFVDRPLGWASLDEANAFLAYTRKSKRQPHRIAFRRYRWWTRRYRTAEWGVWLHGHVGVN